MHLSVASGKIRGIFIDQSDVSAEEKSEKDSMRGGPRSPFVIGVSFSPLRTADASIFLFDLPLSRADSTISYSRAE